MRPSPLTVPALLIALLLGAPGRADAEPHNGGAAIALWPSGYRVPISIVAEPDSGALVIDEDTRNGSIDLYAQRVNRHGRPTLGAGGIDMLVQRVLADGSLAYAAPGLVVCNAAFDQVHPMVVPGSSGFDDVVWTDARTRRGRLWSRLRTARRDQAPLRSGEPLPLEPEHPTVVTERSSTSARGGAGTPPPRGRFHALNRLR